jgi:hypothetical protein
MRVHFVGEADDGQSVSSHHARLLASCGEAVSFDQPRASWMHVCRQADVIHVVTGLQRSNVLLRRLMAARACGVAIVRYWTGLDMLWAEAHAPTLRFAQTLQALGAHQLAPSPRAVERLAALGLVARVGEVASLHISASIQPQPLPAQFTVLCHLPREYRTFYGGDVLDALIRRFKATRFLVLGDDPQRYQGIETVEAIESTDDIVRTLMRATVLIRPVAWACRSRLMLEALSLGRYAIGTFDWPGCARANTVEEFAAALRDLVPQPPFNLTGRELVCRAHDRAQARTALQAELNLAMTEAARQGRAGGAWQTMMVALRTPQLYGSRPFPEPSLADLHGDLAPLAMLLNGAHAEAASPTAALNGAPA